MARKGSGVRHDHRVGVRCPRCHLYSTPEGRRASKAEFTRRYGKAKGQYVYGATVGKVRREQLAKRRRAR